MSNTIKVTTSYNDYHNISRYQEFKIVDKLPDNKVVVTDDNREFELIKSVKLEATTNDYNCYELVIFDEELYNCNYDDSSYDDNDWYYSEYLAINNGGEIDE